MSALPDLNTEIERAMAGDRHRLRRQWRAIKDAERAGKPFDRNLTRLQEELAKSVEAAAARAARAPVCTFDDQLPISARRDEIITALAAHQVLIICGETGSGKSTQLPKICLTAGRGIGGMIGHTQPRRIAARAVAARIAEELKVPVGKEVGFKIRFADTTGPQTYIKLMTDGVLLAESQHDRFLNRYDTIIIDEAHERSLNIDLLLGYLKQLLPRRPDLKLIVTSATIDAARFSEYFASRHGPAPVIEVSGRTFPVEIQHRPIAVEGDDEPDIEAAILAAVDDLARQDSGDMLIFQPTERDIHELSKLLRGRLLPGDDPGRKTDILPLYARLTTKDQHRVFEPHRHRRIVIATNVAESSLTVPGIRYVIDPGTARISRYSPRSKMQRLPIEAVSRASADQRAGRCGRVGPGVCVRLYSAEDYTSREQYTSPEIQRANLASVILQMKSLGFGDVEAFPFLDPPKPEAVRDGYKTLFELGALDAEQQLTPLGKQLSTLPCDPRIGRIVLAGDAEACLNEILIIAAALEIQDPRERPLDKQKAADECHTQFQHEESDFLSYLKLWDFYRDLEAKLSRNQLRRACQQNFLSHNRMREWVDVHRQLRELVEQAGMKPATRKDEYIPIHRALLTGLLANVAFREEAFEYTLGGGGKAVLWPGSAAFSKKPKWIAAAELVETSKRFLRTVGRIDPGWIESLAEHLVQRTYSEPHWEPTRASAMAYEKVSLFGLTIVPRRRIAYGPIEPVISRELFIQHGLVEGDFALNAPFIAHNQKLIEELEGLQTKARRGDFLKGEEARYEFFDKRVPPEAFDGPRFEKWRKVAERDQPRLLFFEPSDLLDEEAKEPPAAQFPDVISFRKMELPLEYRFEPGTATDGITLTVPVEGLNQLDPHRLGWLVPGLLEEKIVALIKSLPKSLRRQFVPAADTAKQVLPQVAFGQGDFTAALADALSRFCGETIPVESFQPQEVPEHLQMNVRVVDATGEVVAHSRNLEEIRRELGAEATASFSAIDDTRWSREGITKWDFGDFPATVDLLRNEVRLTGYPTLLDRQTSVSLTLLDTAATAAQETRAGLRRLCLLAQQRELKAQVNWLPDIDKILVYAATLPEGRNFKQQLIELLTDRAFLASDPQPRNAAEFQTLLQVGKSRLGLGVQDLTTLLLPMMQGYQQAKLAIERANTPTWRPVVDDLRTQLSHLIAPGFLTTTPWQWLLQYPKYFRAMTLRLQKLAGPGLARDLRHIADLQPRWTAYIARQTDHQSKRHYDPELTLYRWLLEEYRVSLTAQELGTVVPVSPKRLEKQWAAVK